MSKFREEVHSLTHSLHNQLCNSIANVDLEISVAAVEKQHAHQSSVVCVDDSSSSINAVLDSKSTSWSNSSVGVDR